MKLIYCLVLLLVLSPVDSAAEMISMRDYIQLKTGMTIAEVLYRVGPFDYESVSSDHHHNIIKQIWYYIPSNHGSNSWITELVFDRAGHLQSLERYRAK